MRLVTPVSALALALAGCATVPHQPPVPVARREIVPPRPTRRVVWQPGDWRWSGGSYLWEPGRYVTKLVSYHRWVRGHWGSAGTWVHGHWV